MKEIKHRIYFGVTVPEYCLKISIIILILGWLFVRCKKSRYGRRYENIIQVNMRAKLERATVLQKRAFEQVFVGFLLCLLATWGMPVYS